MYHRAIFMYHRAIFMYHWAMFIHYRAISLDQPDLDKYESSVFHDY